MTEAGLRAYGGWQKDDERERLLVEQLPQVRYIARRIHDRLPRHVPLEDLVHAGVRIPNAYRPDIVVDGKLVIEVKVVNCLLPLHKQQLLRILRLPSYPSI